MPKKRPYDKHRKTRCEVCGRKRTSHRNLDVHHKDEDRSNNDPSNLQTLCWSCHTKLHMANISLKRRQAMSAGQLKRYAEQPTHWRGRKHKLSTIEKIRKSQSGKNNPQWGKSRDVSTRLKISNTMKGHKKSPETIIKFRARRDNEETKRRKSDAIRAWWKSRRPKNIGDRLV